MKYNHGILSKSNKYYDKIILNLKKSKAKNR